MANNCDDAFQEIQRKQQQKEAIAAELQKARAGGEPSRKDSDASGAFFRDRLTGDDMEVSFKQLMQEAELADSDAMRDFAARAVGERLRPQGSEGWFINTAQLVDRIGVDSAERMVALVQAFTVSWQKASPADFARVTSKNDAKAFAQQLANGFRGAGIALEQDKLAGAVLVNTAPFSHILQNQTNLQILADVARTNMRSKFELIRRHIRETGTPPTAQIQQEFVHSYRTATFAVRSAALSRRVSGQLLQQLQQDPGMDISGFTAQLDDGLAEQAARVFGDPVVREDNVVGAIAGASVKGADGLPTLDEIADTLDEELPDPLASPPDTEFTHNWRRNAKAYYKDSQLFSANTQLVNNYLSGKLIFVAEGARKGAENGVFLGANDVREPIATVWHRGLPSAARWLDGYRVAAEAGILAHDAIRQSWAASVREHFMDSRTPFAGNPDTLGTQGTQDIAEQYEMARKVLFGDPSEASDATQLTVDGEPPATNPGAPTAGNLFKGFGEWFEYPLDIRDKFHVGLKVVTNHLIEKATGVKLPVTSALQMMGAVDHRAGLRFYMTTRANQLLLDRIKLRPSEDWAARRDWIAKQLDDELYQATPSPQNIRDARKQYPILEDLDDETIANYLAAQHVGRPVLASDAQKEAFMASGEARLQARPDGYAGKIDDAAMALRQARYADALFPYWRSPFNQQIWTLKNAMPPIIETARILFKKNPGTEEIAKVAGGWTTFTGMMGLFAALDSQGVVEGNGPPPGTDARRQWLAEGHKPNSLFGLPLLSLGALPVLQTLFLYKDLRDAFITGEYSDYDKYNAWMGITQVGAGQIMRQTSVGQLAQLIELLANPTERGWKAFAGFLANGQINPASGVMRDIERFGSLRSRDLFTPRDMTQGDRDLQQEVDPNDPLQQALDSLRNFAYYSVPSAAAALGQPIRETDYLGYRLRLPDGIGQAEWQRQMGVGTPAVWPSWAPYSRNSRSPVHAVLDRIGMLNQPKPLADGRLEGVLMGEDLEKEYNRIHGTVTGGAIGADPLFDGSLRWSRTGKTVAGQGARRTVVDTPMALELNVNRFMDRLTQGKTLEQALRALFASKTWSNFEADPRFTTDRSVTDRTRAEVMQLPGPRMVNLLHAYYASLTKREIEASTSEAAAEWRALRDAKVAKDSLFNVRQTVNDAQRMVGQ